MIRVGMVFALAITLAACSSASSKAEQELAIIEAGYPDESDICRAKTKVAEAYLHDQKSPDEYEQAKTTADVACLTARLEQANPTMQADVIDGNAS